MLNVDTILTALNNGGVRYMLIGGMNYAIRHVPYITEDVDIWIEDTDANRLACEAALETLDSQWGKTDEDWGPVCDKGTDWLRGQGVFSLYSPHGAIDIFRAVKGLTSWEASFQDAVAERTELGTPYFGLCDADMLKCQLALEVIQQKADRIVTLEKSLQRKGDAP